MYIRRKVFSLLNVEGEERYFSTTEIQKEFGAKSKLVALSPGAWHAKEAMKFAHDSEEDYKNDRAMHALAGAFTPYTAMEMRRKAADMRREGKSAAEVKKYIEDHATKSGLIEAGINAVTGGTTGTIAAIGAAGSGIRAKMTGRNRRKWDEDVKKTKR